MHDISVQLIHRDSERCSSDRTIKDSLITNVRRQQLGLDPVDDVSSGKTITVNC